jgi:hypothetical protein
MATRKLVDGHVHSFPCDAPLEVDRKESIVAPCDHVDRNLGPRFEPAGLAEYDVGLGALVRFALPDNPGRNVMQEVRDEIEVRAEAVAACGRCACCRRSGAVSPLASRLAGTGIIALTNTKMRTRTRVHTSGAVKPPSDCTTSTKNERTEFLDQLEGSRWWYLSLHVGEIAHRSLPALRDSLSQVAAGRAAGGMDGSGCRVRLR